MDINNPDVLVVLRAVLDQQGNGDDVPGALVTVGGAIIKAAEASASANAMILTLLYTLGLATVWAGLWATHDRGFRRGVGKMVLYAALGVMFITSVGLGLGLDVNLHI